MKYRKLRGRIVEKYGTITAFAQAAGMTFAAVSYKLNGKRVFTQRDIMLWCKLLDIAKQDIPDYFFEEEV